MKWISVHDRLPEEDEWVLVQERPYLGKSIYIARRIEEDRYDNALKMVVTKLIWEKDWCCQQNLEQILFWMPLPENPLEIKTKS